MRLRLSILKEAPSEKEKKREKKLFSSTVKLPLSRGTQIGGGGVMAAGFLITPLKVEGRFLQVETKAPHGRRTNDKVIPQVTIGFIGLKCGTPFDPGKKPPSFGLFGTRRSRLMNGEPGSPRPPSRNNAFFASPIQANRSSTNFGIVSKLGGRGGGPPTSCMSFVG